MNEVLPIGSIIYLKEGQQKLMILSRGCQLEQDNELVFFGYSGAAYPVGLNPEQIFWKYYGVNKTYGEYAES